MADLLRILVLEDNPNDAQLLMLELRRTGLSFESTCVDNEEEYLAQLETKPDLILSDYEMPSFTGLRALEILKQRPSLDIPFIIISGTIGEDTAVAAMREGAADYLLKDRITRLGPAIRRALQGAQERREHRKLQAQLIEAQKMEIVGQLTGGIAHDFNNVLGVIIGYGDIVAGELPTSHPMRPFVEEIRHASRRAAGLTRQLLVFSRKQAVQLTELDPNQVIADTEKMLRRLVNESIDLKIEYGVDIGHIHADSGQVWQVMMNLVVNARDAMPEGGTLTVRTASGKPPAATEGNGVALPPGPCIVISVSDTGSGMSEEVRRRIFEPFFTTKPKGKGTGLGLATCQTIVHQAGGHIAVESQPGHGTTFSIYLPRVEPAPPEPAAAREEITETCEGTETLLVVEDDASLRHLARGILQAHGYRVLIAQNGQDALRVAREHRGEPITLVISDIIMPKMSGKVMSEWLREAYPDLKILFTSGYTEEAIADHGIASDTVEFLPKPYNPRELLRRVRRLLDS